MPRRPTLALALTLSACAPADDSAGATSSAPAAVIVEVLTHDEVFSTDAGGAIVRGDLISVHACADGICQPSLDNRKTIDIRTNYCDGDYYWW